MSIEAMKQMANYIDVLGGDSKKYRQAIAEAEKQKTVTVPTLWGTVQYEQRNAEPVAWWKRYPNGSVSLNEAKTFIAEDAIATGHRPLIFGDTHPPKRD